MEARRITRKTASFKCRSVLLKPAPKEELSYENHLLNEAKFCEQCGNARSAAAIAPAPPAIPRPESAGASPPAPGLPPALESAGLEWQSDMKLLNNQFFLGDLVKWTKLTMLVCGAFFMAIFGLAGGRDGIQAALVFTIIPPVLISLGRLIFALIMGNCGRMEFRLDDEGIHMKSISKRVKNINRTATMVGVLAGKPGMVCARLP